MKKRLLALFLAGIMILFLHSGVSAETQDLLPKEDLTAESQLATEPSGEVAEPSAETDTAKEPDASAPAEEPAEPAPSEGPTEYTASAAEAVVRAVAQPGAFTESVRLYIRKLVPGSEEWLP